MRRPTDNNLYKRLPAFVLGFHGCDRRVAEDVFAGRTVIRASVIAYDWLGHGVYFWENNPARALDYARMLQAHPRHGRGKIRNPAVIGAAIDLGFCLNLLDGSSLKIVRAAYERLEQVTAAAKHQLPENRAAGDSTDLLLRHLDCAVIEYLHTARSDQGEPPFDSVRGVFVEGKPLYPQAGFHEHNHIQVCVRSPECILGYFRPLTT